MGYSTDFEGQLRLSRPLTEEEFHYMDKFSDTRRMQRDALLCQEFDDPIREMVGLPIGVEGEFCVFEYGFTDRTVINSNRSPSTQPGLWCQWLITEDFCAIEWNGGEKFNSYFEWLIYLHNNMLAPWGVTFTSESKISYQGNEEEDRGEIYYQEGFLYMTNLEEPTKSVRLNEPLNTLTGDN